MTVTEAVRILHPEQPAGGDPTHDTLRRVLMRIGYRFARQMQLSDDDFEAIYTVISAPWHVLVAACEEIGAR